MAAGIDKNFASRIHSFAVISTGRVSSRIIKHVIISVVSKERGEKIDEVAEQVVLDNCDTSKLDDGNDKAEDKKSDKEV